MPQVIIATGFTDSDGRPETLSEYLCDYPDCPNYASQVIGFARELGMPTAVCAEHAKQLRDPDQTRK